ncbi:2-C-methyl-D-erythritol 2,4-cyclodiphosphate synthase [Andreesenia angusta]|uniref:2-C-methyl-D-erythritol 2,4-cyclodiphosphate synthase n=1 Tax=Andreesenia angusta TaxID=39480 RepID=A0A1S1V701_9FIRM|nr:2-C-methyl-D-erythritol 2,4-cyclodiphosphate synthase [Andreesenia angusta]OHW62393.1 2-C-methyl-D-erythritol 2,4-cyclodiphosphate synthase [Andreesenia angusta]
MKIGIGYDVHRLQEGRKLILGGVEVPHSKGLYGHSDGDVLTHAIVDAILGALGRGDIGRHFPDTSEEYKDIYSIKLLERVVEYMDSEGYSIGNLDCIIAAQKPKLAPYIEDMEKLIAKTLKTEVGNVNIKATTTEKLGFEGREEGISSQAVVLLNN